VAISSHFGLSGTIRGPASAKVGDLASDERLRDELVSMRFVETHRHVTVVGPVGVGKTFIAHALGHIACRHKYSVLAVRTDKLLKTLKHARLEHSHEAELRKLLAVDVLVIDDFGLDALDATEPVGHLDDAIAAGPLGDHVDAIVHGLAELLGNPGALAKPDAAAPDDREARGGAPMLGCITGGAP
jgi:hypothetical protein